MLRSSNTKGATLTVLPRAQGTAQWAGKSADGRFIGEGCGIGLVQRPDSYGKGTGWPHGIQERKTT